VAKKRKYYVVWEGNNPGVYDSWTACQLQVKGYPNALYKAFTDREEAEEAFARGYTAEKKKPAKARLDPADRADIQWESISVDAACSGNPGKMEYRGVYTSDGAEIFHVGPVRQGTNNIGEFLALVHALALLKRKGDNKTPIYSDSRIAMGWVTQGKAKTKLKRSPQNAALFNLISRAEQWLADNAIENPILKWETRKWGEIPADFGRK
jgi:ribonuclease HI